MISKLRFIRPFLLLSLLCGFDVRGGEATPPPAFTLNQALAAALLHNPSLQAQAYESRVAEARVLQAGVRPNPELSAGFENLLGTGAHSGVKSLETTLQLSQLIELGDSRARRVAVAEGELALAAADASARRVEILADVAQRFIETVADTERFQVARRARELAEETVAAVRIRTEAGVVSRVELNRARIELARLQIEEEHAEHKLASCRQHLAAVVGQPRPEFGETEAELLSLPGLPEFEVLAARLEASPTLTRFETEARWREAESQLAQSLRRSGLRVSAGLRRLEAPDDFGFVAGVSMPLPVRDPYPGVAREARERRAQLVPAREAARLSLRAALFEMYQEMVHARTSIEQLTREVIPAAEESLLLITEGYQAGRFPLTELLEAQRTLIELRPQVLSQAAEYHLHLVTIERLLGAPVQVASTPADSGRPSTFLP